MVYPFGRRAYCRDIFEGAKHKANVSLAKEYKIRHDSSASSYPGGYDLMARKIALSNIDLLAYYKKHKSFAKARVEGLGNKTFSVLEVIIQQRLSGKKIKKKSVEAMLF